MVFEVMKYILLTNDLWMIVVEKSQDQGVLLQNSF